MGTNGMKLLVTAGQQFVYICLMAHIPDNFIIRCIKYHMQCQCQLYHTQIRRQMSTVLRYNLNQFLTDFLRQLF